MFIERNKKSPHFTTEELTQIFQQAEKRDTRSMQTTARRLFPGMEEGAYEGLYLSQGPGRAFKNAEGNYERCQYNLVSWPVGIGVLKDHSIHPF